MPKRCSWSRRKQLICPRCSERVRVITSRLPEFHIQGWCNSNARKALLQRRYQRVLVAGRDLEFKRSTLCDTLGEEAGRGLFSKRYLVPGMQTEYWGTVLTRDECRRKRRLGEHTYLFSIGDGYSVDGIREPIEGVGAASLVNDWRPPRGHDVQGWSKKYKKNAKLTANDMMIDVPGPARPGHSTSRRGWLRITHRVRPGEEIFTDYGSGYWVNSPRETITHPCLRPTAAAERRRRTVNQAILRQYRQHKRRKT